MEKKLPRMIGDKVEQIAERVLPLVTTADSAKIDSILFEAIGQVATQTLGFMIGQVVAKLGPVKTDEVLMSLVAMLGQMQESLKDITPVMQGPVSGDVCPGCGGAKDPHGEWCPHPFHFR